MIEWVPIKDWVRYADKPFLILTDDKSEKRRVYTVDHVQLMSCCSPYVLYYGEQITYAAHLNFPKEKTLEEKFDDWADKNNILATPDDLEELLNIAKQHYEGEK